jgi:hypothetical protein
MRINSYVRSRAPIKGPAGSGAKSWDNFRRPSNAICEDNMVTAQSALPGQEKPWLFWGLFDGHE